MAYKSRIILITTDTLHHKFLIKIINKIKNIELIIFLIKFKKNNNISAFYKKENNFEKKIFFKKKEYRIENKIFTFRDVNSQKIKNKIKDLKPELGILFGTKKVDKDLILLFKKKLINIHRGIIESYRGLDSEFWACINKDYKNIGSTIHFVKLKLDVGKIILQKKLDLKKNMKSFQLKSLTTIIAAKNINNIIRKILSNKITVKKKQKIGKYYSKISSNLKEEAIKNFDFYCSGLKK
tara:strand:- start:37499 stop:38212 length:714 start_codon:yes stop_codon:yes gene_type:complete